MPAATTVATTTMRIGSHCAKTSPTIGVVNTCAIVMPMMPCGATSDQRGIRIPMPLTAATIATIIGAISHAAGTCIHCAPCRTQATLRREEPTSLSQHAAMVRVMPPGGAAPTHREMNRRVRLIRADLDSVHQRAHQR